MAGGGSDHYIKYLLGFFDVKPLIDTGRKNWFFAVCCGWESSSAPSGDGVLMISLKSNSHALYFYS
jgi:hypothetical protein